MRHADGGGGTLTDQALAGSEEVKSGSEACIKDPESLQFL